VRQQALRAARPAAAPAALVDINLCVSVIFSLPVACHPVHDVDCGIDVLLSDPQAGQTGPSFRHTKFKLGIWAICQGNTAGIGYGRGGIDEQI